MAARSSIPAAGATRPCARPAHAYETDVFDANRPMGLFTKGKRPQLEEMTGQEKLPVLQTPEGEFITGSKNIIELAKSNPPAGQG